MKSVQGDSGHAMADMVANVYNHIIGKERRCNVRLFDEQFLQDKGSATGMGR